MGAFGNKMGRLAKGAVKNILGVRNDDPFAAFRFRIEIDCIEFIAFKECSGIGSSISTESFQEGGVNNYTRTLVNSVSAETITLKWEGVSLLSFYMIKI